MRRIFVNPTRPHRDAVQEAAKLIRTGRVIAIPTDTLYGLAANPFSAEAVARVFAAKGRSAERALPLIASDTAQVMAHLGALPPPAARLAERFWPGPLTLVVPAPPALARAVTGGTGTVGVRVPDHVVARAVCDAAGHPITATSANMSGEPPTDDPEIVELALGGTIDLLIDAGKTPGGPPSTIVDVSGSAVRLVRDGAIPWRDVEACAASR
jgi:L-threonylcarbamoyladenylate synthase